MTDESKLIYNKAVEIIQNCSTKYGFLAANTDTDNYRRIFSRDGIIIGLAAMTTGKKEFRDTFKQTLLTLKKYQSDSGTIPSNIDLFENRVSFGTTTGRVDSTLWYVIGNIQYFKQTKDINFLKSQMQSIKKCMHLLKNWEFNNRHFIYVPLGGDWADEYINQGYVLYDELLYTKAIDDYIYALNILNLPTGDYIEKSSFLKNLIITNFWPDKKNIYSKYIYHKYLFERLISEKEQEHFISSFSPGTVNFRFDCFANSLAMLFNITDKEKNNKIYKYLTKNFSQKTQFMLPSFYPSIQKTNPDWTLLKNNYNYRFKNKPNNYHNGGLWPLTTGFMSLALNQTGHKDEAKKYLNGLLQAVKTEDYGFYEYLDGKTFRPKGIKHLGFSASAVILAYQGIINNKTFFR